MSTEQINRSDLHYNFLKEIIIRLDFESVLENQLESFIPLLKQFLSENNFARSDKKYRYSLVDNVPQHSQPVYLFINEIKGYGIDISYNFIIFKVNSSSYHPFDEYIKIFKSAIDMMNNHFDFFTPKRFGIRKINKCIVDNRQLISEYFSNDQIRFYDALPDVNPIKNYSHDFFTIGSYQVNYLRALTKGNVEDKTFYQIQIDIDAYTNNKELMKKLFQDDAELHSMNNTIFRIYKKSMTPKLLESLAKEDFELTGITGVEENE